MITIKSPREIEDMAKSGAILAGMHVALRDIIKPGISSWKIEEFCKNYIESHGAIPEQIGFEGYKYATCVSVNDCFVGIAKNPAVFGRVLIPFFQFV